MLAKASNRESIEALVTHAYLQLVNVAWDPNGSRSASLATYGNYQVRLLELLPVANRNVPFLWIELHDLAAQTTVNSFGCDDFEGIVHAAEQVISQAKKLADEKGSASS